MRLSSRGGACGQLKERVLSTPCAQHPDFLQSSKINNARKPDAKRTQMKNVFLATVAEAVAFGAISREDQVQLEVEAVAWEQRGLETPLSERLSDHELRAMVAARLRQKGDAIEVDIDTI
jgi:hypothetical protein